MNCVRTLELLKKYGACPNCGNSQLGLKKGALEITDDKFIRKCKCGWSVEIVEPSIDKEVVE